jgi:NAD-dependent deacetylase
MLPAAAIAEAESEASYCDLMLVLGTSLTVHPAAGIPETALRHGAELVIVNNQSTGLDSHAALHFEELAPTFEGLQTLCASS